MRHIAEVEPWLVPYLPRHGRVALDIGANTGFWTGDLADRFRHVHAFEPNPEISLNGLQDRDNITLWPCAIGALTGPAEFFLYEHSVHACMWGEADEVLNTADRGEPRKNIQVYEMTLDAFEFEDVDFVKVDVEGSEFDVLVGARHTLVLRPPKEWLIEIHSVRNRNACTELLEKAGYEVTQIPHPHGPFDGHLWLQAKYRVSEPKP